MKVAIVGSRTFLDRKLVDRVVQRLVERDPDVIVISGGARGADTLAETAARRFCDHPPVIFLADWDQYGRSAGYVRNRAVVKEADELIALWDGASPGTLSSIRLSLAKSIPTHVYVSTEERWLGDDEVAALAR